MRTAVHEYFNSFFKKHKITQKRFCELTGVPESTIKSLKAKGFYPSLETLKKIIDVFPDFAIMGGFEAEDEVETPQKSAPYYSVRFTTGWKDLKEYFSYFIVLPPLSVRDNIFWLDYSGDVMYPTLMSGDKIALEKVDVEAITMGKMYGVVSNKNLRLISWAGRCPDEGSIRFIADNKDPKFGGYQDIKLSDIIEVYEVVACYRSF